MDTARVDIVYRPLRIAWALHSSDIEGFRTAARLSHTLAGGRFNPIVLADRPQADKIVRTFRADFILPIGDSPEVAALVGRFPQGAVPVSLLLQQLSTNVMGSLLTTAIWSPSLDVRPTDDSWTQREVDFFIMEFFGRPDYVVTRLAFGECKDRGMAFDANDVETMRRVAAAFPGGRFEVYIMFAKLSPFTEDEIALAADLSIDHRVILLTDQELEPFNFYERAANEEIRGSGFDFDALVAGTEALYPSVRWDPIGRRRAGGSSDGDA